jgi:hypothetical protein
VPFFASGYYNSDVDRTAPWWQLTGQDRARQLKSTCDAVMLYQYGRMGRVRRNLSMYEGRNLNALHPAAYMTDLDTPGLGGPSYFEDIIANVARSICATAHAQICSKQQPKASFCVNTADWATKRKAKRAEKCVEAVNLARQDENNDAWEIYSQAMLDAISGCDQGIVKFWPEFYDDDKKGRIRIARCLPWEVSFSIDELKHGMPQNCFHSYGYDRHTLAALFPKYADEIMNAPSYSSDSNTSNDNITTFQDEAGRQVKVREGWRLPIDDKHPGAHAMVVGDADLLGGDDEWDWPFFPFLRFFWEKQRVGGYSTSLIDVVYNAMIEFNSSVDRWSNAERLCSNGMFIYVDGTIDPDELAKNDIGTTVKVKPTAVNPNPQLPTYVAPNSVSEASIQYQEASKGLLYEIAGVTQGTAQGANEPGVTAAIAMRQLANQAAGRLGVQFKHYEQNVAIGATRRILACAKSIIDAGAELQVTLAKGKTSRVYDFADSYIDIPDEAIQVDAVSGLVNTSTDRQQLASELLDRQAISTETYLEMIQAKSAVADLERANEVSHWIEQQIEAWLDFEPGDESREPDDPRYFRYRPPIKWVGVEALTDMLTKVAREYLRAEADDAPDTCLRWFVQFMTDCDTHIQRLSQRQAEIKALGSSSNAGAFMQEQQAQQQTQPGQPNG